MKLEPCVPPIWARGPHSQTILGHLLPSPRLATKGKRFQTTLRDGDQIVGFVQEGASNTVVYLFHGLSGSTDSSYIHRTAILAAREGHTVILANHRGCGEGAGMARHPYHSGRAEDLSAVISHGRHLYPRARHVAIGFSLSGNALLLLMTGKRGDIQPDAAIAVNAPIHLERSAYLLKKGLNRLYDVRFYRQCREDILAGPIEDEFKSKLPPLMTLHDFDDLYTAPRSGFRDREDYYQSCSTFNLLDTIRRPTVLLTSQDDPFVPYLSYEDAKISSYVHLHAERVGGHMGYLTSEKTPLGDFRWQDYAILMSLRFV